MRFETKNSPDYNLCGCRRPGILVLVNDQDWELLVSIYHSMFVFVEGLTGDISLLVPEFSLRKVSNVHKFNT